MQYNEIKGHKTRGENCKMLPKCCQNLKNGLPDLPPMTAKRFAKAKRMFIPAAVENIRQALNPPAGFDLEGRLWRALSLYHYFSEPSFLSALRPAEQAKKLAEVEDKVREMLSLLRDQYFIMGDICRDDSLLLELEICLEHLIKHLDDRKATQPKISSGRPPETGQRFFFLEVAKIFTEATGKPATRKFYKLCFTTLIGDIEYDNVVRMAKQINHLYYKTT